MKKHLLLLLILAFPLINVNAQNLQASKKDCIIPIGGIYELNIYGSEEVLFYAVIPDISDLGITSSIFELTYQDNTTIIYDGTVNQNTGNPQILIPVPCNNKVMQAKVFVNAIKGSGFVQTLCSGSKTQSFSPIGVCGTKFQSLNISPNPARNILNVNINNQKFLQNSKVELLIYNFNGDLVKKQAVRNIEQTNSLDVSELSSGNYILKLKVDNKIINTQRVVISD